MKDNNSRIGFLLLSVLFLAYLWVGGNRHEAAMEQQRIQDSLAQVEAQRLLGQDSLLRDGQQDSTRNLVAKVDSLEDMRLVLQYGDFAISATGGEQQYKLENSKTQITLSNKGGRITQIWLKDFQKSVFNKEHGKVLTPLLLLENEKNQFAYQLPVKGVATPISTEDLYFKAVESSPNRIVFRAFAGSPDKYFEQTYTLRDDYTLDYDIQWVNLEDVMPAGTETVELKWVNYLDRLERSTDYESSLSTSYYKVSEKSPSYCACRGDDTQERNKPMDWVANVNQFFNTALMADTPFASMKAKVESFDQGEHSELKRLETRLTLPASGTFSMSIYSGPNEYRRLAAFGNGLEQVIPYGRSILGTINRWVIRPLFGFFSGFMSNQGLVILIVTFLVKMALFPLTYKMLYSQAKMQALKPQLEQVKKKLGDDAQAIQVETMKMYRETGVNPLGGCLPMVVQMPIWIALYRFFPASIEFRQASFLWADDLSSYEIFAWLPFNIPFYGAHVSLFVLLWALSTVVYAYYNSRHMDMSANPAMKYVQYIMPLTFLFFFNTMAAGLTLYMLFSSILNIVQTLVAKHFVINHEKVAQELEDYKKKPKKEGGFRDKLQKALEEAQKAQETRQKETKKK